MKKKLLKILIYVSIISMLLTLCSGFASAVDPVSAATMANALAQAITAYGASQGVSMTFDVASTDGIGEGVHELWNDFKEDIQDNNVPTYDSLAVTMWSDIYTKVGNNIGININDTEMPYIDAFWNWLLSGPAEMTKVDDQYYEWTLNQNNTVDPITVFNDINTDINGYTGYSLPITGYYDWIDGSSNNRTSGTRYTVNSGNDPVYAVYTQYSNNLYIYFLSDSTASVNRSTYIDTQDTWSSNANYSLSYYNGFRCYYYALSDPDMKKCISASDFASLPTLTDFESSFTNGLDVTTTNNPITVRPYVGDPIPENVYIPDNEDVNYAPLPYLGGIDQLWDTSRFGDGTGTLTDAQKQAISDTVDNAITENPDKTIELADDSPLPAPPNEVYIPFLPLQLPSFNFSLSGIWHYVVTWVGTLGSWFTAMFNMWSCLPYAMVVPVYATLVVVIVLGVYRRFLS